MVYFNRFYPHLPAVPTPTNWVTDIANYKPLLKYYSSESAVPENAVTLQELTGTLAATQNANTKFDVLSYCIKGSGTTPSEIVLFFLLILILILN